MPSNKIQDDQTVQAEIVDSALAAEDFAPIVRLVFDAFSASLNAITTKESLLTRPTSISISSKGEDAAAADAAAGRRASDRTKVLRKQAAAPVVAALEQVLDTKSAELSQICRGNAEEIVSSLQELESMQKIGEEVQHRISEGDVSLRQAGGSFYSSLEQLQDLTRIAHAVSTSCQAIGACKQVISLCTQAGRSVNNNELFKAFCRLQRAQHEFLGDSSDDGGPRGAGESFKLSKTLRLHQFLTSKVLEMETAMQEKAIFDFNNWLVSVRREAKTVGQASLRRAAWGRNREESLVTQRRALVFEIGNVTDLEAFAGSYAKPLPQLSAGTAKLDPRVHPAAVDVLGGEEIDPSEDVMMKIDMTPLHRCLQVHSCLGRLSTFKAYYRVNRRTQLNNDLAANSNFGKQYKSYLAQILGFFVIEDRVARATDAMANQIDAGWETALAFLKPALETAFQMSTDATTFMSMKDLMLLTCSALGACGYHVAPLQDILLNGKTAFYELLYRQIDAEIHELVKAYGREPCEVTEATQAAELSGALGLSLVGGGRRAGDLGPTPPFTAHFSQMLPKALHRTRRFIAESAAYVWGLMSSGEMLSLVRLQRDLLLTNSLLLAIKISLKEISVSDPNGLYYVLQAISDLKSLSEAMQALDDYTFLTVRGVPPGRAEKLIAQRQGSTAASNLPSNQTSLMAASEGSLPKAPAVGPFLIRAHQTCQPGLLAELSELDMFGEERAQQVFAHNVKKIVQQYGYKDWEPEMPIRHAGQHSDLLNQLVQFVDESMAQMQKYLWEDALQRLSKSLFKCVASTILGLLLSDKVPSFNVYTVFALTDDALALAEVAEKKGIPGLTLCDLLATGRVEEMLDEKKRQKNYPAINLKNLQVVLSKFREVRSRSGPSSTRTKQPESFLKRKAVEKVAKLIRL